MDRNSYDLLWAWVRDHDGVVTVAEAQRLGVTRAMVRTLLETGRVFRVGQGILVDAGRSVNRKTDLRIAVAKVPGGVVSHASAAWLWELVDTAPRVPTLTVPRTASGRKAPAVVLHRSRLPPLVHHRNGFPVTTPVRTILDLGATVEDRALSDVVDRAISAGRASPAALAEAARSGAHHRGAPKLRRLLAARGLTDQPAQSILEAAANRVIGSLVATHRMPSPQREYGVAGGRFRLDYAWPEVGLGVEVDGYSWHAAPGQMAHDYARRNHLVALGWVFLTFTGKQVMVEPGQVTAAILATYERLVADPRRRAG